MTSDQDFMSRAIELSRRGYPAPNPRVGAVVVCADKIVGEGFHEMAGMPHAEVVALSQAGARSKGGTLYVTLEPCAHHGKTPPCTDAIIAAGIARVVVANRDANPDAAGGGERLKKSGIEVDIQPSPESSEVNRVFEGRWRLGRPYVVVKAAITMDGFIADAAGNSKWITDEAARKRAHELRAEMGCVLIGAETALRDNPSLTCREAPGRVQVRVVLDPERRLPNDLGSFTTGDADTVRVVAGNAQPSDLCARRLECGAIDLRHVLEHLGDRGVIGVLVEGGGKTIGEFFRQRLVDEIELHVAPKALGAGLSWLQSPVRLAEAWRFEGMHVTPLGDGFRVNARVAH
jgi:diaminohydroxyphosphoribosylaminopyrimidine deaminase/5-amino-6-(5-phosphoribosylamino)uracil reductase